MSRPNCLFLLLLQLILIFPVVQLRITLAGNVEHDFRSFGVKVPVISTDNRVIPSFPTAKSGFVITDLRFGIDEDALLIGVNCFGWCGDADGDGNPNTGMYGPDGENFEGEYTVITLNFGRGFEFVIGFGCSADDRRSNALPCGRKYSLDQNCFGLYFNRENSSVPFRTMIHNSSDDLTQYAYNYAQFEDLEWGVAPFSTFLKSRYNKQSEALMFDARVYAGRCQGGPVSTTGIIQSFVLCTDSNLTQEACEKKCDDLGEQCRTSPIAETETELTGTSTHAPTTSQAAAATTTTITSTTTAFATSSTHSLTTTPENKTQTASDTSSMIASSTTSSKLSALSTISRAETNSFSHSTIAAVEKAKAHVKQLYSEENNLRIGIGVGVAAFVAVAVIVMLALLSRKRSHEAQTEEQQIA
jgi:hypothetical protein